MKTKIQELKAFTEGYSPRPFFFREKCDFGKRYVAWTPSLSQLKKLVYNIINNFSDQLEVLLKICFRDKPGKYRRFYGKITRKNLLSVMKKNEFYIYSDGMHQLCIRDFNTDEYIALDDHDILFIYSNSQENVRILKNNNFEKRKEKLLMDLRHWHREPKDSKKLVEDLIKEMNLEKIR